MYFTSKPLPLCQVRCPMTWLSSCRWLSVDRLAKKARWSVMPGFWSGLNPVNTFGTISGSRDHSLMPTWSRGRVWLSTLT